LFPLKGINIGFFNAMRIFNNFFIFFLKKWTQYFPSVSLQTSGRRKYLQCENAMRLIFGTIWSADFSSENSETEQHFHAVIGKKMMATFRNSWCTYYQQYQHQKVETKHHHQHTLYCFLPGMTPVVANCSNFTCL